MHACCCLLNLPGNCINRTQAQQGPLPSCQIELLLRLGCTARMACTLLACTLCTCLAACSQQGLHSGSIPCLHSLDQALGTSLNASLQRDCLGSFSQ